MFRDGTLGPPLLPGDTGRIPGGFYAPDQFTEHLISEDLGDRRGANLFHSFRSFNLEPGVTATFTADLPTQNILARVTDGYASQIDGILQSTVDGASLYFLNPAGVHFGFSAELKVPASFHVTMADYVRLGSAGRFDAFPGGDALLTTDPPSAFGFLSTPATPIAEDGLLPQIRFQKPVLRVPSGATFSAVGRDFAGPDGVREPGVVVVGRFSSVPTLQARGGRIQLASVAPAGAADLPTDLAALEPDALAPGTLGSIRLADDFPVLSVDSTAGLGPGTVVIRAGQFLMDFGRITANSRHPEDAAPTAIDIAVSSGPDDTIEIRNGAKLQAGVFAEGNGGLVRLQGGRVQLAGRGTSVEADVTGSGRGGGAVLAGSEIQVDDEALVLMRTTGAGDGGDITLDADTILIGSGASLSSESEGAGAGGDVTLAAEVLELRDGGQVSTRAGATGAAGEIRVEETGALLVTGMSTAGPSGLLSRSVAGATGQGGALHIAAETVRVEQGGEISSSTSNAPGGDIELEASRIEVDSTGEIVTRTSGDGTGEGGAIVLQAESVTVARGAKVRADTEGPGPGGELRIDTTTLVVSEAGQISTGTRAAGVAGNLSVVATESVSVSGVADGNPSGIFARSEETATAGARGGDLRIETRELLVQDGGEISARTLKDPRVDDPMLGVGDAGNLIVSGLSAAGSPEVMPADRVRVAGGPNGRSVLSARGLDGDGGSLSVTAQRLELADGGEISASTVGKGSSGNVEITANEILISGTDPVSPLNRSGVFAQTNAPSPDAGDAGELAIHVAQTLEVSDSGRISVASRGGGQSGSITIDGDARIELSSGGEISAQAVSAGTGGSIDIAVGGSVSIASGGLISAQSSGAGDAGSVAVHAAGIDLAGGAISTQAQQSRGGDVTLSGGTHVALSNGAEVSARAAGAGDAGSIQLEGTRAVSLSESSRITATGSGSGDAGQVVIGSPDDPVESLALVGASAITTEMTGTGDGGRIQVSASGSVELSEASTISARSSLAGSDGITTAGDIALDAGRELVLVGGSSVTTEGTGADPSVPVQVSGGQIAISALDLVHADSSQITTSVRTGAGEGGDIQIPRIPEMPVGANADVAAEGGVESVPAPEFVVLNQSQVIAQADEGPGGDITIRAQNFVRSSDSIVDASSQFNVAGQVVIESPENNVTTDVVALPSNFVDVTALLASSCAARHARTGSFVVRSRDWIPPAPDAPLRGFYPGGADDPAPLPRAETTPAPANAVCVPDLRTRATQSQPGEGA